MTAIINFVNKRREVFRNLDEESLMQIEDWLSKKKTHTPCLEKNNIKIFFNLENVTHIEIIRS